MPGSLVLRYGSTTTLSWKAFGPVVHVVTAWSHLAREPSTLAVPGRTMVKNLVTLPQP